MNQDIEAPEVLIELKEGVGVITLNRPQALNALTLDMIRDISASLHKWENDNKVKAVVFMGAGERAFCAGGDIKSFYSAGMNTRRGLANPRVPVVFFAEEYSLNRQIFHYSKLTVAFMDGITMGGGYGIGGHCNVRIATGNTVFAMPEVGIGFFPDVGSLYHLHKCPGRFGAYLALTGDSIDGRTMAGAGLADVFAPSLTAEDVLKAVKGAVRGKEAKATLIHDLDTPLDKGLRKIGLIDKVFADFDLKNILQRLEQNGTADAADIFETLLSRSSTSLMVTAAYLEKSQDWSFENIIAMDFILAQNFVKHVDLYEGIRAQVIDKDKKPLWSPEKLDHVEPKAIQNYFQPTGYDLKDVEIF